MSLALPSREQDHWQKRYVHVRSFSSNTPKLAEDLKHTHWKQSQPLEVSFFFFFFNNKRKVFSMLLRDEIEPNKLHAVYKTQCVVECKLSTEQRGASPLRCPLVCPTVAVHARCKNWTVCSAPLTHSGLRVWARPERDGISFFALSSHGSREGQRMQRHLFVYNGVKHDFHLEKIEHRSLVWVQLSPL